MAQGNFKMAITAIKANSWRSFLTMLGVVIGVMSVLTIVSLGEGARRQVIGQINQRGDDHIAIVPGNIEQSGWQGSLAALASNGTLTEADWIAAQQTQGVMTAVPFATVDLIPEYEGQKFDDIEIVATTEESVELISHDIAHGDFFSENGQDINSAVIGRRVAEKIFKENVPLGKSFTAGGETFLVHGVFEEIGYELPILSAQNFDNAILLSYDDAKVATGASLQINQILVNPAETGSAVETAENLRRSIGETRGGQINFSVLTSSEMRELTDGIVNLLTGLVGGIAAVSLLVGGVGIMNIMLVSVSERTKEIGVRKAIGATDRQILMQFLIEAIVLCLVGSLLGVVASELVNFLIMIFTPLEPVITLPFIGITVAVCLVIGVIFGLTPAVRASRMAPIDALRYE